ncbi:MAG: hypothetical protein QOC80_1378 [Frankiaceae bacterium]|nr:hypothetical protein [Frankiaceae bacterium]
MTRQMRRNPPVPSRPDGSDGSHDWLLAHPFDDLYGSDRMFLQSVAVLGPSRDEHAVGDGGLASTRSDSVRITAALPDDGALAAEVRRLGVPVVTAGGPVLRRAMLTPGGLARLTAHAAPAVTRLARLLRTLGRPALYVNTVASPFWLPAARLAGVPAVVHVHEAEQQLPTAVRRALTAPLLLADAVVTNSNAARDVLLADLPSLASRTTVVYNGVPGGPPTPLREQVDGPLRVVFVGRLSPRKAPHLAIEAIAALRRQGRNVRLDLVGDVFTGYEWYRDQIDRLIADEKLEDAVTLHGFRSDVPAFLQRADVCVVPSEQEPFGNVAVEAMLAGRPVVVSAVQGLAEIVDDGRNGWSVPPGDVGALAGALARVHDQWPRARSVAAAGAADARDRFSVERYAIDLREVLTSVTDGRAGHAVR